jgi:RNA polymerase sigma-70 factor (ECF subfamily)
MANHPEPSSRLLDGVRGGSTVSWRRLLELYAPVVLHWCRRKGLREADADDVLQDVFRTVLGSVAGFRREDGRSFVGWLFCITRSRLIDHRRWQARGPLVIGGSDFQRQTEEAPQPEEDPEDETTFRRVAVRRALDVARAEFEPRTWQAFWRTDIEGQNTALVAKELAMSVARCRVRRRLRDLIMNP